MRSSITFLILLAITLPAQAQDSKTKPNTLTPKEIADGWILLFDGERTFGWSVSASFGEETDRLVQASLLPTGRSVAKTRTEFGAFELDFEYRLETGEGSVGVHEKLSEETSRYALGSLPKTKKWAKVLMRNDKGKVVLERPGLPAVSYEFDKSLSIAFETRDGGDLTLRNVRLRPLNTKPLFNAKDLTGWKTFPGDKYKSIFTVTDQGDLNVKNGPGDLQTVGKYQNFVLQLECISHGEHLNSGIFFRCRDNEYQNGYEAQIRNQFTPEATQDYLIEVYDPMTNKLLEKKKLQSTAVDYGTGAIYRRQPARKEMAKDGEWFAMTIVAHGNHLATWVNGVQVTDWHDHRPKSDNARTGCKLDAGHISIQGHDPTTNLSFRNLRIAAWPK